MPAAAAPALSFAVERPVPFLLGRVSRFRGQAMARSSLRVRAASGHARARTDRTRFSLPRNRDEDAATQDFAEMRAIASGDAGAFARLAGRESPRLLRFAQGLLGNPEEAEDIVQETLIRLFETAAGWEPQARVGTWLHRVCYNRCIDQLRRRRPLLGADALEAMPDSADLPDMALMRSETVHSVREALEQLPYRQRTALLLFHFQEMAQRDSAAVMGISETAFESLLARARRQLRALLSEGGGDA